MLAQPKFLPTTRQEMTSLGWDELDILLVSGDAYVDHPSFGTALLGRWLVHHGYRAGIIAQPRWTDRADVSRMGRPRLFAGVTAGALDSMLAHYTAFRKKRSDDAYTPGGKAGARPNRACLVYTSLIKQAFPGLPIVLGGIEASLRRISHYDFWTDKVRRSILLDAKADLLLYGMAERGILCAAKALEQEAEVLTIPGAVSIQNPKYKIENPLSLPSHEEILADPRKLMDATLLMEKHVHQASKIAIQPVENRLLVLTPPRPLDSAEMDALYSLPFTREPHPSYKEPIPAAEMIRFSVTAHRGCAGGCSFCSLAAHQGRGIRSRSEKSIVNEAQAMTRHSKWTGSITDVGGPTANMWGGYCADDPTRCERASCLYPTVCPHFVVDQMRYVEMLHHVKQSPGVKHVRVASGIRHDLALKDREFIRALVREFVGGQLKIAPEHLADRVLTLMRKPRGLTFEQFLKIFEEECKSAGKEQFVIPYLISAFPGCQEGDMKHLADYLARKHWKPQQVQCFIPLPGTVAAAMYHAGIDTHGKPIAVPKTDASRLKQHFYVCARAEGDQPRHGDRNQSARRSPR